MLTHEPIACPGPPPGYDFGDTGAGVEPAKQAFPVTCSSPLYRCSEGLYVAWMHSSTPQKTANMDLPEADSTGLSCHRGLRTHT